MAVAARLGVLVLPEHTGRSVLDVWRRIEELGVDHGWVPDHLTWRTPRECPWFDAMTTLTAAAVATRRIGVGTLVASPNFRHPVLLATQAMAVDHVSEGRLTLGVGAGSPDLDNTQLGRPEPTRMQRRDRFEEFVVLLDRLLRQPVTSSTGQYYSAVEATLSPGCVQRPRAQLGVAASGHRGIRLAVGTGDLWITTGDAARPGWQTETDAFGTWRCQLDRVDEACAVAGRAPATLRRLVHLSRVVADPYGSPDRLADLIGRSGEVGFTDVVVPYPREEGLFAGNRPAFETAVLALGRRAPGPEASD